LIEITYNDVQVGHVGLGLYARTDSTAMPGSCSFVSSQGVLLAPSCSSCNVIVDYCGISAWSS
jgi:hypothetical protein